MDEPEAPKKKIGRPRKYTDDQRAEALRVYMTAGPTTAEAATGVPASLVTRWAKAQGLSTMTKEITREATETVVERRRFKREIIAELLHDIAITYAGRLLTGTPFLAAEDDDGEPRPIAPMPTPEEASDLSKTLDTIMKNVRLESGDATSRTESTNVTRMTDAIHDDAEWAALQRAIQRELSRRGAAGVAVDGEAERDSSPDTGDRDAGVREEV